MKRLFLILFLLIPFNLFAIDAIKPFKPTYIIAGDKENQVKYQISFRYNLIYPFTGGIAVAYTQLAHWNLYDKSSPFRELNHNPMIFIERTQDVKFIDFYRIIPYSHISNGLGGPESRSVESGAVEMQLSHTAGIINFGIREKFTCFYALSKYNLDYKRYIGNFETEIFTQIKGKRKYLSHERLSFKGEFTKRFYWYQIDLSGRIFTAKFRPHIYVQWRDGYGEFLIDYNKRTRALRAGFIFNPE